MIAYLKNPLTIVWAVLTLSTVASWFISQSGISQSGDREFQINVWATVGVLTIAIVKAQLVIRYFMEVRFAPRWLKLTMISWTSLLLVLLLGFYWVQRLA